MTKLNGRDAEHLIAELDVPRRPAGFAAPEPLQ